jgi:hypothetical protein
MARVLAGVVRRIDGEHGRVRIGSEEFQFLEGLAVPGDVGPGASVRALVIDRDGGRAIIHLHVERRGRS